MISRHNFTQDALEAAGECRAYEVLLSVVETREAIVPLERRRLHRLARLVSHTPCCRRAD